MGLLPSWLSDPRAALLPRRCRLDPNQPGNQAAGLVFAAKGRRHAETGVEPMQTFSRTADTVATVNAPADTLFAFLDDHKNLSSHMNKSSGMMLGSRMEIYLDAAEARSVGSKFGFKG